MMILKTDCREAFNLIENQSGDAGDLLRQIVVFGSQWTDQYQ